MFSVRFLPRARSVAENSIWRRSREGGGRLPKLEDLLNDIAADLADVFQAVDGLDDNDRRHRASRNDEAGGPS